MLADTGELRSGASDQGDELVPGLALVAGRRRTGGRLQHWAANPARGELVVDAMPEPGPRNCIRISEQGLEGGREPADSEDARDGVRQIARGIGPPGVIAAAREGSPEFEELPLSVGRGLAEKSRVLTEKPR